MKVEAKRKESENGNENNRFAERNAVLIFEGLELFNAASSPDAAVRAFELFREAAERGSRAADFMLGVCFDFGCGVAVDKEAAYRRYESAAESGLAEARHNLGFCEIFGEGTPQNVERGAANF